MNKHSPLSILDKLTKVFTLFLLVFIPLYPKLPLLDIASTWVYIRLEDVAVAIVVGLFMARTIVARRLPRDNPLLAPIIIYWSIGFLSTLLSITIVSRTIWHFFPHLTILHFLRRIEYMMVFFVAASTITKVRDVVLYVSAFFGAAMLVNIYAYAQKYLQYPAFLTMNEEFAKGEALILTESSRIASTFAGHYDLAAYSVFAIIFFGSLILGLRNIFVRVALIAASGASVLVLLWTQSRNSFLSLGIALLAILWWHKKKVLLIPIVLIGIIAIPFVLQSSDRYAKTIQYRPVLFDSRGGQPVGAAQVDSDGRVLIEGSASPGVDSLPIGSGFIRIPTYPPVPVIASYAVTALRESADYPVEGIPTVGEEAQMAFERNELQFSTVGPVATTSGEVQELQNRFFLDQALTYDISITTRFQGTWPRAWEAFSRNILTGSGYSVLDLASDNDYLRALGETGILGLFTFLFIFFVYLVYMRRAASTADPLVRSVAFGVGGGIVSLLIAAFFVDIFEASKMAYVLWIMMGVSVGALMLNYKKSLSILPLILRIITHPLLFIGVLAMVGFVLFGDSQSIYFLGDDFTWLTWASSAYIPDISKFFTDATGFFYRPLSKLYFMGAYSLFWFKPAGYHLVNVVLHTTSAILVYLLVRQTVGKTFVAIGSAMLFLVMAVHHENVFWISGISSLAGSTSALASIYFYIRFLKSQRAVRFVSYFLSLVLMAASLLWYEGMLAMPFMIVLSSFLFGKRKSTASGGVFILLIPFYWMLRSWANAVAPSGNYGIDIGALPFNVVGNSFGYLAMSFVGPAAAEFFWNVRVWTKSNPVVLAVSVIGIIALASVLWKKRTRLSVSKEVWFWVGLFFIALIPYLGLGNIAERYGYLASCAVAALVVIALAKMKKVFAIICIVALMGINWWQLSVVRRHWNDASMMSVRIGESTRKLYFPIDTETNLIYVAIPHRHGRAWVFPVGLGDALNNIFGDNRLRVYTVGTREEGVSLKRTLSGVSHVLVMADNYEATEIFE